MSNPRVLFGGVSSGCGKTTVVCGFLNLLVRRNFRVSSFKCGPDYIDPMFHKRVIGTSSSNLDLFFMGDELMKNLFLENASASDISVAEGVMGYFDGMSVSASSGSSYDIARVLDIPSVLVIDAYGQSLSSIATLRGFICMDEEKSIKGVIFNRMSKHVYDEISPLVREMGIEPLGYVPKLHDIEIKSRHLGLVSPDEVKDIKEKLNRLSDVLEETLDVDKIIKIAESASDVSVCDNLSLPEKIENVKIGVAYDEAFSFIYKDNLEMMRKLGANIVFFSPIHDSHLHDGIKGIILPGGYPELYAKELSENTSMLEDLRNAIKNGMPCLAECGGFLYLHDTLEGMDGKIYPMAGVIDAKAFKTDKLNRFGYVNIIPKTSCDYIMQGEEIKGHEFHYYESSDSGDDMLAVKPNGARKWQSIHAKGNLFAGFAHLFYYSNPEFIYRFLKKCDEEKSWQNR